MGRRQAIARTLLFFAGVGAVLGAALFVLALAPTTVSAEDGLERAYKEEVRYWTPSDGWQVATRTRTFVLDDTPAGGELREAIEGPHGPRGDSFRLHTDADGVVVEEPGVRVAFPPSPPPFDPFSAVHLGVPWERSGASAVAAIDSFERVGTAERHGLRVTVYEARHVGQFYVTGETAWFRSTARVAFVEPLTGRVVDYEDHETLWRKHVPSERPLSLLPSLFEAPERVWDLHAEPTEETRAAMAEDAKRARTDYFARLAAGGLPLLLVGEGAMAGALLWGRTRPA